MEHPTRRELLGIGSAALLAPLAAARPLDAQVTGGGAQPRIKIAVSTYSVLALPHRQVSD